MFQIYNALSRKKEEFVPINPGKVGMYVCGPTVYDHCHIGHARGYVSMDAIRRYLTYKGLEVRFIMNYTDVGHLTDNSETGEDKIEKKAQKEKIDPMTIVEKYIASVKEDFSALNILPANFNPRPTQYIRQIIEFNQKLIEKGIAYEVNGSVYFSVDKFPDYGKLSGRKKDELLTGARVEINPEKHNPLDFALWIKAPKEHLLKWESPWSIGYPGWHIECSVMSYDLLGGGTFDIHGGGNENRFPHNENEIAQTEALTGEPMAHFWTLWNMVNIDGVKMSKSLNNFLTIKDALKKYPASVIRLWILSSHYRSLVNFSEESLKQAEKNLERIINWRHLLDRYLEKNDSSESNNISADSFLEKFEAAMDDDFNTPEALSALYALISDTYRQKSLSQEEVHAFISAWEKFNRIFALTIPQTEAYPEAIIQLAEKRKIARLNKDYSASDEIRKQIESSGFTIEDLANNEYTIKPL